MRRRFGLPARSGLSLDYGLSWTGTTRSTRNLQSYTTASENVSQSVVRQDCRQQDRPPPQLTLNPIFLRELPLGSSSSSLLAHVRLWASNCRPFSLTLTLTCRLSTRLPIDISPSPPYSPPQSSPTGGPQLSSFTSQPTIFHLPPINPQPYGTRTSQLTHPFNSAFFPTSSRTVCCAYVILLFTIAIASIHPIFPTTACESPPSRNRAAWPLHPQSSSSQVGQASTHKRAHLPASGGSSNSY